MRDAQESQKELPRDQPPGSQAQGPLHEQVDFDALVENYADFVYSVAHRLMGNPEDAQDVAQDAFLSAYRSFQGFRGDAQVSTWLYRITTNAALMRLRKSRTARLLTQTGLEDVEVVDWTTLPDKEAINSELRRKLDEGLALLAPDLRAAVVLRDVQGLSTTETAETLEISVAAVKSRLHRGRVLLRRYLSNYVSPNR